MSEQPYSINILTTPHSPSLRSHGVAAEHVSGHVMRENEQHGHDIVELFFILKGRGVHWFGRELRPLSPGDMGLIKRGQHHCIVTPEEPMDVLNIYIDPERLHQPGMPAPLQAFLNSIQAPKRGTTSVIDLPTLWRLPDDSQAHQILTAIDREAQERQPGFEQAIELYVRLLLLEFARLSTESLPLGQRIDAMETNQSVERARQYLEENWAEQVSLDDVAKQAKVNKHHLCRLFRRETGMTVTDYVHRLRIREAMQRLRSDDSKIITIAYETGFGDLAHFNRMFRRLVGLTPSAFREQARSSSPNRITKFSSISYTDDEEREE